MSDKHPSAHSQPQSQVLDPMTDFGSIFEEEEFRFRDYCIEDYLSLVIFWVLILVVFLQFFTRYVMGDSTTWTEEIARYLLIGVGFVGSVMAVRKGSHIMVEFFYHYMPDWLARLLTHAVAAVSLIFYVAMAWVAFRLAGRTGGMMISVDLPKSIIYYTVSAAFLLMAVRCLQHAIRRYRHNE
ncbi:MULTISPECIES: TRAP transporter small permease [Halomonadaceae]|uniref:TRAP transporter small permease n=1 Tax=Halomonadaceae TaxID=28256 RepID=UPI001597D8A3|nr:MULTISPECIES: TRAP transporter small permease [Halomonas]QJQ96738.1 TRAP transporter small permease [Halomonas sp. PA5]